MGRVDTTLFIKHVNKDILIIQIYADDILFGSTNDNLCQEFLRVCSVNLRWATWVNLLTFSVCK